MEPMANQGASDFSNFSEWGKPEIRRWLQLAKIPDEAIEQLFKAGLYTGAMILRHDLIPGLEKFTSYVKEVGMPPFLIEAIWTEIEVVRGETKVLFQRFAGWMHRNSTSLYLTLDKANKINVAPIPLESSSSTAWRTIIPSLDAIDDNDSHKTLMEKLAWLLGLWAKDYPKLRYWIDNSKHEKGELYADATVGLTPTKKSESKELQERTSTKQTKDPHPELEWDRSSFVIEVANVKEFAGLNKMSKDVLRNSTLSKKIAQLTTYMLNNMISSNIHQSYGAVTCYSHWLFVKGEIIGNNDICYTVHDEILPLHTTDNTPCALGFLNSVRTLVLKAVAQPKKMYARDEALTLVRLDEGGGAALSTELVASTGRSIILKASWPSTKQIVCIKCNQGPASVFDTEVRVLKRLNAAEVPNIPRLLCTGTLARRGELYRAAVTDLVGESIDKVLPMPLDDVRYMALDILAALTAMHQNGIVHSDVKPANIIRKWNEKINRYSYYLIDFGFSFESGTITDGWGCSIEYASVEMLKGSPPTFKDDMKALWYTVMHALMGKLPWQPLHMCSELTLWSKQGWTNELRELNNTPYTQLANLYDNIDVSEPHEAWSRYLRT